MRAHKYQVEGYDSELGFAHDDLQIQNRIFIPGHGIFAYRSKDSIDFFTDYGPALKEARKIIKGGNEGIYLGEVELPKEVVLKAVSAGRELNKVRCDFVSFTQTLIELIEKGS